MDELITRIENACDIEMQNALRLAQEHAEEEKRSHTGSMDMLYVITKQNTPVGQLLAKYGVMESQVLDNWSEKDRVSPECLLTVTLKCTFDFLESMSRRNNKLVSQAYFLHDALRYEEGTIFDCIKNTGADIRAMQSELTVML